MTARPAVATNAREIRVARLRWLQSRLMSQYGPQRWWPADSAFEVFAGSILVQRTRWRNAELALRNLDSAGLLTPQAVISCPARSLERAIRPAGFYRQKTRCLRSAGRWLLERGGIESLRDLATSDLRAALLRIRGVGPETADCILLYVFHRPVFVADAYARRIFLRLGWISEKEAAAYQRVAERIPHVDEETDFFNELHALIVAHGKGTCASRPNCRQCSLRRRCATALDGGTTIARRNSGR